MQVVQMPYGKTEKVISLFDFVSGLIHAYPFHPTSIPCQVPVPSR